MSQHIAEIPLETPKATLNESAYPTIGDMTTSCNAEQNATQQLDSDTRESESRLLRLKGGAGCLTDFLAAIGCCCICEDCCCYVKITNPTNALN